MQSSSTENQETIIQLRNKKRQLVGHLRDATKCRIRPSTVLTGEVGVFAETDIEKNARVFDFNGNFNEEQFEDILLNEDDLLDLPNNVATLIRAFLKPNRDGTYPIPRIGLTFVLGIHFYCNTSKGLESKGIKSNAEFGESKDGSGYIEIIATRNIKKGEEIFLSYEHCEGGGGRGKEALEDFPIDCRVCKQPVLKHSSECVNLDCKCAQHGRLIHRDCALTWFQKKLEIRFQQRVMTSGFANNWSHTYSAPCEICKQDISENICKEVIAMPSMPKELRSILQGNNQVQIQLKEIEYTEVVSRSVNRGGIGGIGKRGEKRGSTKTTSYQRQKRNRFRDIISGAHTKKMKSPYSTRSALSQQDLPTQRQTTRMWDSFILKRTKYDPGSFSGKSGQVFLWEDNKWAKMNVKNYVTAERRSRDECKCKDAVCACPKRSRGMYKFTAIGEGGEEFTDYFSDYDETVKIDGKQGKQLWEDKSW